VGGTDDPVDATTFLCDLLAAEKTERCRRQDFRQGASFFPELFDIDRSFLL